MGFYYLPSIQYVFVYCSWWDVLFHFFTSVITVIIYFFLKHKPQTVLHQTSKRKGPHIQFANDLMDTFTTYACFLLWQRLSEFTDSHVSFCSASMAPTSTLAFSVSLFTTLVSMYRMFQKLRQFLYSQLAGPK